MDNATYLKNVMRTLSAKPAQIGLRYAASNLNRTHFFHAAIGLGTEMAEVFDALSPWLLGSKQWSVDFEVKARDELGDVGYYMRVLAKLLKVKLPSSTKKVKLKGMTRSEALFQMNHLAGRIANLAKKNFYGPTLLEESAGPGKTKLVVDKAGTKSVEQDRMAKAAAFLEEFVGLYWAVAFDMLHLTPSVLFDDNITKLAERYPEGFFDAKAEANKDPEKEAKAVSA